ncbi:hypothetical protein [Gordonia caeni]
MKSIWHGAHLAAARVPAAARARRRFPEAFGPSILHEYPTD